MPCTVNMLLCYGFVLVYLHCLLLFRPTYNFENNEVRRKDSSRTPYSEIPDLPPPDAGKEARVDCFKACDWSVQDHCCAPIALIQELEHPLTTGFPNLFDNLPDKFSGSGFFGSFNTDTKTNDYSYQSKPIRGNIEKNY